MMRRFGHMPLPPYIEREDTAEDRERYQTLYGCRDGAVAAPTAGLHFDQTLLDQLDAAGIPKTEVTLHVGAGTFQPVGVENIEDHTMHSEYIEVDQACCDAVTACRDRGGRVIAIGTTAVRSLESAVLRSVPTDRQRSNRIAGILISFSIPAASFGWLTR